MLILKYRSENYNHECKSIDTVIILLKIRRFRQKMDVSAKIYLIVSQNRILFVGGFTESPIDRLALLQPIRSREDNNASTVEPLFYDPPRERPPRFYDRISCNGW